MVASPPEASQGREGASLQSTPLKVKAIGGTLRSERPAPHRMRAAPRGAAPTPGQQRPKKKCVQCVHRMYTQTDKRQYTEMVRKAGSWGNSSLTLSRFFFL